MKPLKIIHITDLHQRHSARLFYSTGKKINNGLVKNGHNVINISDRDLTNQSKNILDISGRKILFKEIIKNIENFRPDLIIFGHVDRLDEENFYQIKERYNSIRLAQWFIDPLNLKGPDFIKNKQRFFLKYQFCDANFITTSTEALNFIDEKKTFFIPNPIDPSIDVYKNFLEDKKIDIFLAISHGQHRGILKRHFIDDRVYFINRLTKKVKYNIFGYKNNPVWGQNFFTELNKCSMGINLSRGEPIKYYSSDRISSLLGNGLLTFIHKDYNYSDFFPKNSIITYSNLKDLNKKIIFFQKNKKLLRQCAKKSYLRAHKIFNNQVISEYIVNKSMNLINNNKKLWINI
jgi:hypothetical protein|tara:strand:- start:71 stop:1111 length:1041 start_codon:yes stop_codon:yes gene_type:complete